MNKSYSKPMIKDQVYTTTDYFMFKPIDGNRHKNLLHLKRLKDSIVNNYLFTVIIVNDNYQIIDGQHRFEIIKELGLPLNYIICEGYGLKEVHILNANSKTWTTDDYLDGYCNLGYKEYLKYRDFKDKYDFNHNVCIAILGKNRDNTESIKRFWNGEFEILDINKSTEIADKIMMFAPFYEGFKRRTFILSLLNLFDNPNFEFTEMIQKLKIQPTALVDCVNVGQYTSLIEEIYNYKRRIKVNLRYN